MSVLSKISKLFDNTYISGGDSEKEVKDILIGEDDGFVTDGIFRHILVREHDGSLRYHLYVMGESYVIIVNGLTNKAVGPTYTLHLRQHTCGDYEYYNILTALKTLYDTEVIIDMLYYAKEWRVCAGLVKDGTGVNDLCRL